jgi:hypothetical protein
MRLAWLGHAAWHLLSSGAVFVLVLCNEWTEETFCSLLDCYCDLDNAEFKYPSQQYPEGELSNWK